MANKELTSFTNDELLEEVKKNKSYKIYDAVIIGFLVGVAVYATATGGFGLLTFLPLVYLPIAAKNRSKNRELQKLLTERNLELKN